MKEKNLLSVFISNKNNTQKGVTIIKSKDDEIFISYADIYNKACIYLEKIQEEGVKAGEELLYQVKDNEDFIYIFWACQLGGITAVPVDIADNDENNLKVLRIWNTLYHPHYLSCEENLIRLNSYKNEENSKIITDINKKYISIDISGYKGEKCFFNNYLEKDYIALIQFSSGSTGIPKGIPIKYSSLYTHVNALAKRENVTESDVSLNWAPLSHNLGMISVHLVSTLIGINQYIMSKDLFVKNPLLWMDKTDEHNVTMIYSPNFGYKYVLSYMNESTNYGWDLSKVRMAFNGAEPINYDLCKLFVEKMKKYGLHNNVICPAYGCSEATSVISIPNSGDELVVYKVDRKQLNFAQKVRICNKDEKDSINLVSVGFEVDNCEVRICDADNNELGDFYIGNLQVRGKNVIDNYYNNEEASKSSFCEDGWFNTGDLCFRDKNNIVITGRSKEIIFINGQNYYPYDIERVIEQDDKTLAGKIAVCGIFNKELQTDDVYAFVESDCEQEIFKKMADKIKSSARIKLGLHIANVIQLNQLEKTGSGKLQRLKMANNYLKGDYKSNQIKRSEEIIEDFNNHSYDQVQEKLIKIWKETLNCDELDLDSNFFDIGGSSNLLIILNSKLNKYFKNCVSAIDIFEAPTIEKLTQLIISKLQGNNVNILGNKFALQFYNEGEGTVEYKEIIKDISVLDKISEDKDLGYIILAMYLKLINNVIEEEDVNANILYKDEDRLSKFDMNVNCISELEDIIGKIKELSYDESIKVDIKKVKNLNEDNQITTIFNFNKGMSLEILNELKIDIAVNINDTDKEIKLFVNKNKINFELFTELMNNYESALLKLNSIYNFN